MKQTIVLVILDGWGIGRPDQGNPLHEAKLKNIDFIKHNFPAGALQASGIAVGLPWEEEGNSEVGHLTIGAGKVLYQHFPRISLSIREGDFFQNPALKKTFEHARANNSAVNLIGLLTQGNVHASFEHLEALLEFANKEKISKVNLHLFTDGKDSPPKSILELLKKIRNVIAKKNVGVIASLSGRYYAMERDRHWDRTERAYKTIIGEGELNSDPEAALKKTFERNRNEEFLEPMLVGEEKLGVHDNDAVIFFNFREDSMRQIVKAFAVDDFQEFPVKKFKNLYIATMTRYEENLNLPVAFLPEEVEAPLGKILSENGKIQLRIAETEKYAHVTYFFNGLQDAPYPNEYRVLVPSRNVVRHDQFPEMMAVAITDRALSSINEKAFDFILVNYANADIIAHTGNYEATLKAVEILDSQIGLLLKSALNQNCVLIITSDHGNAERLIDPFTALPETKHDPNPVPIYLIKRELQKQKTEEQVKETETEVIGILADIAPTILELMRINQPKTMGGQSILKLLK